MKPDLPIAAPRIAVEWLTFEGGIGITAATDTCGAPLMGIYSLNRFGHAKGHPLLLPRARLMTDMLLAFEQGRAISLFIDAEITFRGLCLTVSPPAYMAARGKDLKRSAQWGTKTIERDFFVRPSNDDDEALERVHFVYSKSA